MSLVKRALASDAALARRSALAAMRADAERCMAEEDAQDRKKETPSSVRVCGDGLECTRGETAKLAGDEAAASLEFDESAGCLFSGPISGSTRRPLNDGSRPFFRGRGWPPWPAPAQSHSDHGASPNVRRLCFG